jgi:antitoxin ParD1/3/4
MELMRHFQMNIFLKPEHEQFIQAQIQSGKYASADEVISAAFQLLQEQEQRYTRWVEETRQKVEIGLEQVDRGEVLDATVVIGQLQERLRQAREAHE